MLDKLIMTSPRPLNLESAGNRLKVYCREYTRVADNFYAQVGNFKSAAGVHLLSICTEPKKPGSHPLRVITNPSKFADFRALDELISQLGLSDDLYISRLDYKVDIDFPVETLWENLFVPRKKVRIEHRDKDMTGFYLGRYPECVCVYSNKKLKRDRLPECRVEVRQHKGKLPIGKYKELPTLVAYKPFSGLSFKRLRSDLPPGDAKQDKKVQRLKDAIAKSGASGAFKALNQHSNFKRDFEGLLEPSPGLQNLDDLFLQNLTTYFGGKGDGDRQSE